MIKPTLLSLSFLMFAACSAEKPTKPAANNKTTDQQGDDHGTRYPLAEIKLEEFDRTVKITQLGEVEAGTEGAVEVEFDSSRERISTIRAWVGIESGVGSMKGKMEIEGDNKMHGHVEIPDPIPADSKLWMEIELDGKTQTISLPYK